MEPEFWKGRWAEGRIGFHRDAPNPHLVRHGLRFEGWPGRGFFPLCGKSVDLAWAAARGADVVGNELVETAVEQFFREHGLEPTVRSRGTMREYVAPEVSDRGPIRILQGDFFELHPQWVGPVDWVFDRAAFIALPPERRADYAEKLLELAESAREILLVTLTYPPGTIQGPPFSVRAREVEARFGAWAIERIEDNDVRDAYPHLVEQGLPWLHEAVFRIRRPT